MDLQLRGKTGLVTGASSGIGRRIAVDLAREGVRLVVTARRRELLEELSSEIEDAGGPRPAAIIVDITADGAPENLADDAQMELGTVDVLINNVGRGGMFHDGATEAEWEAGMTLNFDVARKLTGRLLPGMRENGWGRVISIGAGGNPAKAALIQYTRGLARENSKFGITANCVRPGKIISEQMEQRFTPEFLARQAETEIAVGEYGQPEDLASMVCFLASPLCGQINGAIVPVDGGYQLER